MNSHGRLFVPILDQSDIIFGGMISTLLAITATLLALAAIALFSRVPAVGALVVLIVAAVSLYFSHWAYSSSSWQATFGGIFGVRIGVFIEFFRTLLAVGVTVFALCRWFPDDYRRTISLDRKPLWWIARMFFASVVALTIVALWRYHLDPSWAALDLAKKNSGWTEWAEWADTNSDIRLEAEDAAIFESEFRRPYLWYMPYSMANFVAIAVPLFAIPVIGGCRDVHRGRARLKALAHRLASAAGNRADAFKPFRGAYEEMGARYIAIVAGGALLFAFEAVLAKNTLSDDAIVLSYFAVALVTATGLALIVLGVHYERGFKLARTTLDDSTRKWTKANQPRAVLMSIMNENVAGLVLFGVSSLISAGMIVKGLL